MARGSDIVVAGAGALGSTVAFVLARAGFRITLLDRAPDGPSASRIAAGMLAPAFESLFDASAQGRFSLLARARDLWPDLAADIGLEIAKDGALALGTREDVEAWADKLRAAGARAQVVQPSDVASRLQGAPAGRWGVHSPDDWRLESEAGLAALRSRAVDGGARLESGEAVGFDNGAVRLADGRRLAAETLVAATGAGRRFAPELGVLVPIKGHILRADGDFGVHPVVRAGGVYLCRSRKEAILGATMETGRADAEIEPEIVARLLAEGGDIVGGLGEAKWRAAAGVRAATPDGLPLAGPSRVRGVILAAGARRNGWLLAPLVADAVLAALGKGRPVIEPSLLDPRRFETSSTG
jgi:glycine oxidase